MRWKHLFALLNILGLACGLASGVLLLIAMTLQRTDFRLVKEREQQFAICFNDRWVAAGYGGPLVVTDKQCPIGIGPSITPAIQYEHPSFVTVGLWLLFIGFALQIPAASSELWNLAPHERSISEEMLKILREQLR